MKKYWLLILIILFAAPVIAREIRPGMTFMTGGRYDNLRMCVASAAGVKGGPIGDGMFSLKFYSPESFDINLHVPILRPILFGAAFEMLQFEPEVTLEFKQKINLSILWVGGPGMGISFHYGPDYRSSLENKGESFFAAGPLFSGFMGLRITSRREKLHYILFKIFYSPLFSKDETGHVAGGALVYSYYFI